jgi:hypothetical protein
MDFEWIFQEPLRMRCKRIETSLYYLQKHMPPARRTWQLCLAMPTYAA